MFPTTGLFKKITCPEYLNCQRVTCVFTHSPPPSPVKKQLIPSSDQLISGTKRKLKTSIDDNQIAKKKAIQDQRQQQQQIKSSSAIPRPVKTQPTAMMAATSTAAAAPKRVTNLSRSIINNKSNNNSLNSLLKPASSSSSLSSTTTVRHMPTSTSMTRPITTTTKNISSASSSTTTTLKTTGPIKTGVGIQPSMSSMGGSRRMAHKASFNATATGPPNIVPTLNCHAPLKMRQLISQRLYEQFLRIYQPILSNHPTLATEHTKCQEAFILEKTSNQAGYKQMATNILMNLKKRPEALNDQDTGIDGEWEDPVTKEQQKVITLAKVTKCILSREEMEKMGYPLISVINNKEDEKRSGETIGSKKTCDRCKKEYIVKDVLQENDLTLCQFHHGRMRMVMNRGEKLRQYTCCDESYGSMGCAKGPHVYKDENVQDLHAKIPFISTPEGSSAKNKCIVVALDCEMAYTTAGMELVRLTAIDEHCKVLLDELVFPSHMVIDLNTRYSGIKTLAGARHNLDSVRKELFKYVDANTILLGHGLENDMNALRLIHPKIIDTAALYPHPKGLPYRYGLRVLSTRILQKFIQDSTEGHDSFEDAKTCVDLLEKYLKSPQGQKL